LASASPEPSVVPNRSNVTGTSRAMTSTTSTSGGRGGRRLVGAAAGGEAGRPEERGTSKVRGRGAPKPIGRWKAELA
jgi:hypothetical protein